MAGAAGAIDGRFFSYAPTTQEREMQRLSCEQLQLPKAAATEEAVPEHFTFVCFAVVSPNTFT